MRVRSQHRVESTPATEQPQNLTWVVLTTITVVALLAWHLWTLLSFPAPHVDEGWFANRAVGYLTTGVPFGSMDAGVFDRFSEPWLIFPLIPTVLQALVLRVVGGVDLTALRLLSLVAGAVLLYLVYRIGSRVAGRWAGTVSVALVGASLPFVVSSHYARHDVLAAAAGWGAVAIFFVGEKRWLDVAAGVLVVVAVEMHPNAAIFGLTLVVLALLDRVEPRRRFLAICAGGLIGLVGFFAVHVFPNPDSYSAVNSIAFVDTHVPPVLTGSLDVISDSFILKTLLLDSVFPVLGGMGWLLAIAGVAALVALYVSRIDDERRLAQMAGLLLMFFALLVRNNIFYYVILVAPAIALALSAGLVCAARLHPGAAWRRSMAGLAVLLIVGLGVPMVQFVVSSSNDFDRVATEVAAALETDEVVMGAQNYWLAAPDNDWRSWESLVFYRRLETDSTVSEAFRALDPDVLIVDTHLRFFVVDENWSGDSYVEALALPAREFDEVLASGRLVTTVDDGSEKGVEIYRFP